MVLYPDISHYHPVIDWDKVKKECGVLISKATQGTSFVDKTLDDFIRGCEKYKIPYWLYTYLDKGNEKAQAEFLVSTCKNRVGDYFVGYILDVEEHNDADNVRAALDYLSTQSAKTMVYTMYSEYQKYSALVAKRPNTCAWWEARYGRNNGSFDRTFDCHVGADFHQYSSEGYVSGIGFHVDLNRPTGSKPLDFFTTPSNVKTNTRSEENKVVRVGSARIDENGRAHSGKAGDQTGKEVAIENWYLHNKGWFVIRAKDAIKRDRIAKNMEYACNNPNIGYDQYQNQTLWNVVKQVGFDCSKVTTKCETDCARLVRVCVWYAGVQAQDFYTATELQTLKDTGQFEILTSDKYCKSSDYLMRGDILVTRSKGHTVVVLDNGAKIESAQKKGGEEMQCTYTVDKKGTVYWFDGHASRTLSHPDQLKIVRQIYKANNGIDLPHYDWTSKAPWYIRLQQAANAPEKKW